MSKSAKYTAEAEAWDSGDLGQDEKHVKRADAKYETTVDEAMGLQMISIRLQKQLIEDMKFIAMAHGIGYQPLIRDVLSRFVAHEVKQIIRDTIERRDLEEKRTKDRAQSTTKQRQRKAA